MLDGIRVQLGALEPGRDLLAAVVEQKAQGDGNVQVDAQNVGLDGCAEAYGSLEVNQSLNEAAAGSLGRGPNDEVKQALEHISAHAELEGVFGAGGLGWVRLRSGRLWLWLWL